MRRLLLILLVAAAGLGLFGYGQAMQDPRIVRYTVPVQGLEQPLRIVQLSDSHASAIDMPPQRLQRVVAMMNALKPELVVLSGDYLSGNPGDWSASETRAALAPFASLRAPLGVLAVVGNHDSRKATRAALASTRVRVLIGERITVGPLTLVGADSYLRGSEAVEQMRRLVRQAPAGRPVLVLAHEPDFFQWLQARPVVMIAGHTHGGQIRLPFIGGLLVSDYARSRLRGVFHERGSTLVVSSGLGSSLLPVRLGVPPEIVLVTLVPVHSVGRKSGTER